MGAHDVNLSGGTPAFGAGKFGNARLTGYGAAASTPVPPSGDFSVEAWLSTTNNGATRAGVGQQNCFYIGFNAANRPFCTYGSTGAGSLIDAATTYNDGQLHHLLFTFSATLGGALFVDGKLKATSAVLDTPNRTGLPFYIGALNGTPTFNYVGAVDEIVVHNGVLRTADFTPPSAPAGNAIPTARAIYHLESSGLDSFLAAAATAVTLAPPFALSGLPSTASSPFYVSADGSISGTVVVTPSDGGAGGVFTPATVSISSASPLATFTYTPSAAYGRRTISITNNGTLANPPALSFDSKPANSFSADDANVYYSPYNWVKAPFACRSAYSGAYLRVLFTGAAPTLYFDVSSVGAGPITQIVIDVDRSTKQRAELKSSIAVVMPSGAGSGDNTYHLLEVYVESMNATQGRWSGGPPVSVCLVAIALQDATKVLLPTVQRAKKGLIFGDSMTEGLRSLALNGTPSEVDRNSAIQGFALEVGRLLGAEIGVIGVGAIGLTVGGAGGVPPFPSSWNLQWLGVARDFSIPPDYCIWVQGYNDNVADTVSAGIAALNAQLAAMPGTRFFVFRPFTGRQAANLQAIVAGCNDPSRVSYIDTSGYVSMAVGVDSPDGTHPYGWANVSKIAPSMANAIKGLTASGLGAGGFVIGIGGGVGVTPRGALVTIV